MMAGTAASVAMLVRAPPVLTVHMHSLMVATPVTVQPAAMVASVVTAATAAWPSGREGTASAAMADAVVTVALAAMAVTG